MIYEDVKNLFKEIPPNVEILAAAKGQSAEKILQAVEAGIKLIGENYIQEAQQAHNIVGGRARWHFIGHLQKNKVKKAVQIFDMIETVDSLEIAVDIDKECGEIGKIMPVLIEINCAQEPQKYGAMPDKAPALIEAISKLEHMKIQGLMTMGPASKDAQRMQQYFAKTRQLYDKIKGLGIKDVEMRYLSMGMSDSYKIAIKEGANIIRLGTKIFGKRDSE